MRWLFSAFAALSALSLIFAIWQIAFSEESLAGLWLVFWALTFLPIWAVVGAWFLWNRFRLSNGRGTQV
jgi:hypothetical protein